MMALSVHSSPSFSTLSTFAAGTAIAAAIAVLAGFHSQRKIQYHTEKQHEDDMQHDVERLEAEHLAAVLPPLEREKLRLRRFFPFLRRDATLVFLENAGGSAVTTFCIDAVQRYFRRSYVQLGAGYEASNEATETVEEAHTFAKLLVNAGTEGVCNIGNSSSMCFATLAILYSKVVTKSDTIIIAENAHESNAGPWVRLAEQTGATLKVWKIDRERETLLSEDLMSLLDESTRLVAFPVTSNVFGEIADVRKITKMVHAASPKARVVVDAVAYAPHRAINVQQWDADYVVFSPYKVYSPHMSVQYSAHRALAELGAARASLAHFFVKPTDYPYALELGGVNHEACAGFVALKQYLNVVLGRAPSDTIDRDAIEAAFAKFDLMERPLTAKLIKYLLTKPQVRIRGSTSTDPTIRLPTISFTHSSKKSSDIVKALHARNIACRNGHMYAYRLVEALGVDIEDGVVRISAVHYNTISEVNTVIDALEEIL